MGVLSNKISRESLKRGDHIYSWRNAYIYAHHGIYVGEEKVIHFTRGAGQETDTGTVLDRIILSSSVPDQSRPPCPICGDQSNLSGVITSCLDCFLYEGNLYLFKYGVSPTLFLAKARGGTCTLATSDPPEDVLHRANFLLKNGFGGYNIFKNNCEDFAIYCKTGLLVRTDISVGRSGQATAFVAALSAVVSSPFRFLINSFAGLTVLGYGMYCVGRYVSDIGERRDAVKVSVERLVDPCGLDELAETTVTQCNSEKPNDTAVSHSCLEKVVDTAMSKQRLVLVSCWLHLLVRLLMLLLLCGFSFDSLFHRALLLGHSLI